MLEEHWAAPSDGVMIGMFKLAQEGNPNFYEFFFIVQDDGQWVLKLKHFGADFAGWEEKDDYVTFPLVSVSPTEIAFDGLVMKKISDDQMEVGLSINRNGEVSVEHFLYSRVGNRPIYD